MIGAVQQVIGELRSVDNDRGRERETERQEPTEPTGAETIQKCNITGNRCLR